MSNFILETQDLTVQFGGLVAVKSVSLQVAEGTLQSVIGPNGAGKTTLFNLISGVYRPTRGQVLFRGRDITGLRMDQISLLGLGRSFQITNLFPGLNALENVRLAAQARRRPDAARRAAGILEAVGLGGRAATVARTLPHGDKRKLEIGMLLALEPDLLLLDEPTAGVSSEEVPAIIDLITGIKAAGKTILLVEHKMDIVMRISDRITVLQHGGVIAEGTPAQVAQDPKVRAAYLGGAA